MTVPAVARLNVAVATEPFRIAFGHVAVVAPLAFVLFAMWPPLATLLWCAAILIAGALEAASCWIARLRPSRGWSALEVAATTLSGIFYALTFGVLMGRGEPSAKLFALVLITCSMTFVLLRHHSRPWSFVLGTLPQMIMLLLLGLVMAVEPMRQGNLLSALGPMATFTLLILTFWAARRELSVAWKTILAREQAAADASQAKSAFLATVSHEIRTPLNGVLGMAQAMTGDELADVQRERLKIIRHSGENLLAILDDVLDLSKIESGRVELENADFHLGHLVRGAVSAFSSMARQNRVDLRVEIDEAAAGSWRGDPTRVRQLIHNLVSNAVKFTHEGEVTVVARKDDDEALVIAVSDTGIGIAAQDVPRLFDKFVQGDSSSTRRYGGAGLGLTLTKEVVGLMGGSIEVASEVGAGSTFTVRLPLEHLAGVEPEPAAAATAGAADPSRPLKVLVAEDNRVNQMVIKTLLAQAGVEARLVENGLQAVEACAAETFDIVLMDIQMPEMDGVAATRAIRQREAQGGVARLPIVAVTANVMTHQAAEYRAAGMDGMAAKPLEVAALFSAMEGALEGRPVWSVAA